MTVSPEERCNAASGAPRDRTEEAAGNQDDSPFHEGERAVQARAGVADKVGEMGRRMLRDHLIQQHIDFYPLLPLIFLGLVDREGRPWASVLTGQPGFVRALDPTHLRIGALPAVDDPIGSALGIDAQLGVLGIELHTRRRNRLNGRVVDRDSEGFVVAVDQSFGNCPKYIQARALHPKQHPVRPAVVSRVLDLAAAMLIRRADTLFIASAYQGNSTDRRLGSDVSHRGGRPGFVQVESESRLIFPDYVGNNAFQTLGNITMNPRVGLLFLDFDTGTILQLSGRAEIIWDRAAIGAVTGAERLVRATIEQIACRPGALPFKDTFLGWSPTLPEPGA
jgi:predicted pyridoxine 5'-phosphate oxidase superfamily flavin-nucleotide-binding protein